MSNPVGAQRYGLGGGDAYYDAVKYGGYTGTREQFGRDQAEFAQNATAVAQAKEEVERNTQTVVDTAQMFTEETVPAAIQSVEEKADTEEDRLEARTTELVQSINTAGAVQVQAVEDEGTEQIGLVSGAGTAQVEAIEQAGSNQVDAVELAGSTQVGNVNSAGTNQVGNVNTAGVTQVQAVEDKGEEVLNSIPADYTELMGDVDNLKSAFDDFKNGIDTLNGSWVIGVLDVTTVYPNLKYMVCNPTIQQYDRNIVFSIASGYYLNVNYFNEQGTRTAAHSNRTGTFTVPSGTRFNVSVTENPLDTSLVITDMTRFVNAITFNTIVENRIEALEVNTAEDSALVADLNDGDTFITDGWQVGALDKTTVYPNVDRFTLSNPVIRSFGHDVVVHVKSGFKYTVNIFNENGERTSVISNNTVDRVFPKGQRFNLYVNRNPVDSTEVITDKTKIEFKSAVYFRSSVGQELDELKKSVDPIAEPNDYYFANNYIQNKCTDIDNLAKSCAANGDVFIFITDEHWTLNEKQSTPLIRYISKQCNIPMVIDGGDGDDYGSNDFCTALNDSFSHKIHHVVGNHDWFPPTNGNMLYYWMDMFNNDQIGNAVEHYYYVDNQQKRIRYIVINAWVNNNGTLESGYSNEQLSWFTNTALNVPAGWDILVFTHFIGDSVTATPEGAQGFRNAIDAYNADSSHTGKVIAIISGHTHFDTVCHTAGGVPIIMTTCDKNKGNGEGNEPWLSQYRPNGTIYEQAFDVMFLDRVNKTITALRIGCPAMDNTDLWPTDAGFDFAPTLEQRVINYN